jgi:hypothetical protein
MKISQTADCPPMVKRIIDARVDIHLLIVAGIMQKVKFGGKLGEKAQRKVTASEKLKESLLISHWPIIICLS